MILRKISLLLKFLEMNFKVFAVSCVFYGYAHLAKLAEDALPKALNFEEKVVNLDLNSGTVKDIGQLR